ncbi:LADA_0H09384g1_1 [Lachancea dasiensis]|uniref:LADA_0H09384g1_1 n=1 Tax=Lachancea dasiensis TaxID=1072105 RepID=A0A1G4K2T5_9SACH|nr:LADA_0H09384g1_1 [Lachancea dasiensis]
MFRVGSGGLVRTTDENCERLKCMVERSVEQNNLETAEFLAELLFTEVRRLEGAQRELVEAAYLYGLVLYLKGDPKSSQAVVRQYATESLLCAYVLARSALKLDRTAWNEATRTLDLLLGAGSFPSAEPQYGMPDEATMHCILGQLYFKLDRLEEGRVAHSRAVELDPYLWESFKALCDMGANVKVGGLFKTSRDQSRNTSQPQSRKRKSVGSKSHPPFKVPGFDSKRRTTHHTHNQLPGAKSKLGVPTTSLLKPLNGAGAVASHSSNPKSRLLATPPSKFAAHERSFTPDHTSKRANTNFNTNTVAGNGLDGSGGYVVELDAILYALAKSYKCASRFDCYKAVRILNERLPRHILTGMPWVLAALGKLHFELVNYEMSRKFFVALRDLQPFRVRDMEIYSTLMWHLNDSNGLSYLSHELLEVNRLAPETWCCVGNLFSLKKDHEESTKAFQRSTQLDPLFTYAYTLQGHEYSSNDALDTAMTCYRMALASNSQHYNAYYGLGMCCLKLGQYEDCFLHFEKARSINPVNVILICCCGVALEKLSHQEKALEYYDLACELQPMSSLALFKRAQLLLSMGKYNIALESFEQLVNIAPHEATVHFLLGQLYQIVGRKQDAIKELTVAMNLDPKGSQLIQTALEKCHLME